MTVQNWQKEAKSFRGVKYGSPSLEWTSGLEHRLVLMEKVIDFKGKKVLDVGCGIGMFLEQFQKLGAQVFGVDVDTEKITIAKKNFRTVYASKAEKLPFQRNMFDIILLHEVIEHVEDDKQTIQECYRVLKKGGKLIVFAPNRLWPFETHGIFRHDKYHFGNIFLVTYLPNFLYKEMTPHVRNYFKRDLFALLKGLHHKKIIYRRIFPGFDKLSSKVPFLGKIIQRIFRILDLTPLNIFGISHFLIIEKN